MSSPRTGSDSMPRIGGPGCRAGVPAASCANRVLRIAAACGKSGLPSWACLFFLAALLAGACTPPNLGPTPTSASAAELPPPTPAPTQVPSTSPGGAVVVFVKDGDLLVWDEATGQTQSIFDVDDAINLTVSDDGEVV